MVFQVNDAAGEREKTQSRREREADAAGDLGGDLDALIAAGLVVVVPSAEGARYAPAPLAGAARAAGAGPRRGTT